MRYLIALAIFLGLFTCQAAEPDAYEFPVMRVPKLVQPPTIDGTIDPAEWQHAAAFTGVTAEGSVGGHGSMVPEIQQVQWYLGYDDTYLYLAMRSPQPKGTYPVARTKENDLIVGHPPVLFEDHVEVQILSHGRRDLATTQGKGFYKIMANPKAAYIDQYLYNGTIGTEELWSMGGPLRCRVTPEAWELEMAVEIGRLKLDSLDNRDLVMQLVRTDSCTGMYFAGWVGEAWLAWKKFPEVSFVPETPAFRFLKLGELGAGQLDAKVELVGNGKPADVDVQISVTDADDKTIYQETKSVKLGADAVEALSFAKTGLAISKVAVSERNRRNHFEIKATAKQGRESVVLYHIRSPFMQVDAEFREQFLDKWIAGRPQSGEWEYKIAYKPYSSKLEASVDLDFFGVPEAVQKASAYRVVVVQQGGDKVIAEAKGEIHDLLGERLLMDLPTLAEGTYVARFELLDPKGGSISRKEAEFVRKIYPWEHNQLGISDEVIHPFDPLTVNGNAINMWGRTYTIGGNGLPAQIVADPPSGTFGAKANLLAAPIRLVTTEAGKEQPVDMQASTITSARMNRVDLTGTQASGAVQARVSAFVEYDGWYEVEATLGGKGSCEAVDLIIDLDDQPASPIDTLYVQRLGDGRNGNEFSGIPRQPGVHFKSTELLAFRGGTFDWKSFVPRTYVGNGDRGLWFFAWSAAGWELADNVPVVQVERLQNGDVRLRLRLLAGPVEFGGARKVHFALQATPAKPNNPRYRTYNEESLDVHDTRGYRYYGKSVDGFVNDKPEDYEALRKFVLYGQRYQEGEPKTAKKNYSWWHGHYMNKLGDGAKLVMYGSGQLMGMGAEEFHTFGGEWVGKSNWQANRSAASDRGRYNYQGTEQWDTDVELSVTGVNWTQSMIDFFVWYHKPLMEKAGFNGTWWDNTSMGIVREYNPELGRMEETWLLHSRRQLIKRLHVLGWQLMRTPVWASNMHVDLGFSEIFWMVENDWYADGADMTALDQWSMGQFRAMARTKSTMQIARPWLKGFNGTTPEQNRKIQRSVWAMLMSHDIQPSLLSHYTTQKEEYLDIRRALSTMRGLVDLTNTNNCLFAGYWVTGSMVQPAGRQINASVYTNGNLRTAAVLFFNGSKQDQYLAGTALDINALIPIRGQRLQATRIFDIESGETVATVFEDGKYIIKEPYLVSGNDFRLLGIEAE